ncbi:MAG: site-specific integrase [Clostridia bacterium]|nr:site-specific integrase [Clostridia bacterium]
MAHVRKLKNGTFQAAVYVCTSAELDKHGKPKKIYEYITCDSEKECKSKARELETDIENRTYSSLGKMKFDAWANKWIDINFVDYSKPCVKGKIKASTQVSYKMYIETHFKPFFGRLYLREIQEMHIKEYISKKLKYGLSPTTVRKHFYLLNAILYDALKVKNPCRDVEPPKAKKYTPHVLTEAEFELFHAAFKNTWDEIPLLLGAWCGMRLGEIFCLKWGDIDKDNCMITIDETRAISEFGYIDDDPKSERGMRTIPISQKIIDLLEARRTQQEKISHYIFQLRPDSYSERFGKIIDRHNKALKQLKAGKVKRSDFVLTGHKRCIEFNLASAPLPDIRFHDLRHYHATILYKNNIADQYAAERLGHDILVLKKIYQHLELSTKKEMDDKVRALF